MASWDAAKWRSEGAAHAAELEKAGFVTPGPRTLKPKVSSGTSTGEEEEETKGTTILGLSPWVAGGLVVGVLFVGGLVGYQLIRKNQEEK